METQVNKLEWIKVSDRKPNEGVTVAVLHRAADERLEPYVFTAKWWPDDSLPKGGSFAEVTSTCGCCQYFDTHDVTHWAPTPIIEGKFMTHDEFFEEIKKEKEAKENRKNVEIKASKINKI